MSDFQLVRHKAGGSRFELATKKGLAKKWRESQSRGSVMDVVGVDAVFTNFSKGERASEAELTKAFGTSAFETVALQILEKGELQVTTDERRAMTDQKRREMIEIIHKSYVDPKTNLPHPVARIELAFDELKIHADPDEDASRQVREKALKKLQGVLALKKNSVEATLSIPNAYLGQANGIVYSMCEVLRENYGAEALQLDVALSFSDLDRLLNELKRITNGDFDMKYHGGSEPTPAAAQTPAKGNKGKGGGGKGKK